MQLQKKAVVIVDGFSTGRFLAPAFNANGYHCIHVCSEEPIPSLWQKSYNPKDYIKHIVFSEQDGIDVVLKQIAPSQVKCVMPGSERGVNLADRIAARLDVPKNDVEYTQARRNKYHMIDALRTDGVPCADQFKSKDSSQIVKWFHEKAYARVVVKPLTDLGAHGVKICSTEPEIRDAFNNIVNNKFFFGHENREVLVQEYLEGMEYVVNTVSRSGVHFVTDIWRMRKEQLERVPICSYSEVVFPEEPEHAALSAYVKRVLEALKITNGPAHSEIMFTPRGPVLVETGARCEGVIDISAVTELFGYSHVSLAVQAILAPQAFLELPKQATPRPKSHALHVYLISHLNGEILREPNFERIQELKSFHSITFLPDKAERLNRTDSLFTSPGYVYLLAEDPRQLEDDYRRLRAMEPDIYRAMIQI